MVTYRHTNVECMSIEVFQQVLSICPLSDSNSSDHITQQTEVKGCLCRRVGRVDTEWIPLTIHCQHVDIRPDGERTKERRRTESDEAARSRQMEAPS